MPRLLILVLAGLLAGCLEPLSDPFPPGSVASRLIGPSFGPVDVLEIPAACTNACFEPTLAAGADGTLVLRANHGAFAVSPDGGASWWQRATPPLPPGAPTSAVHGENALGLSPQGLLVYAANVVTYPYARAYDTMVVRWHGIHVAVSDDDGLTWRASRFANPVLPAGLALVGADRPWLAFGPHGEIYLSYLALAEPSVRGPQSGLEAVAGIAAQRSDDGGATWTAPAWAVGPGLVLGYQHRLGGEVLARANGRIAVDGEGRVFVAALVRSDAAVGASPSPGLPGVGAREGLPPRFVVAVSEDGGRTFSPQTVWERPPPAGGPAFPAVAVGADGSVLALARTAEGQVRYAISRDGGRTWTEGPAPWNNPARPVEWGGLAVAAGPGWFDAAWYEGAAPGPRHFVVGRLVWGALGPQTLTLDLGPVPDAPWGTPGNTDFAEVSVMPAGGFAAVWADAPSATLRLALETAP